MPMPMLTLLIRRRRPTDSNRRMTLSNSRTNGDGDPFDDDIVLLEACLRLRDEYHSDELSTDEMRYRLIEYSDYCLILRRTNNHSG